MPMIQSTITGRWVSNQGPIGGNVITASQPSNLNFSAPLGPPLVITWIRGVNNLFANPGQPGNDNVIWAPTPYTWHIHFDGGSRRISDPNTGRFWVNTEAFAIPLAPGIPVPLSSFNVI